MESVDFNTYVEKFDHKYDSWKKTIVRFKIAFKRPNASITIIDETEALGVFVVAYERNAYYVDKNDKFCNMAINVVREFNDQVPYEHFDND